MKTQETLEEVAERLSIESVSKNLPFSIVDFTNGYQLALQRSYSEEEVLDILVKAIKDVKVKRLTFYDGGSEYPIYSNLSKWFEKYKKK